MIQLSFDISVVRWLTYLFLNLNRHFSDTGQGLGASNQGIQAPIKPSLKFDTAGVGHDPAAEFTSNSWEANYNR